MKEKLIELIAKLANFFCNLDRENIGTDCILFV